MLIIQTESGNFGHPKDLMLYMEEEGITKVHVIVQYCFKEVFEKDMSAGDVSKWASAYISPVAGTLEDAIKWLMIGVDMV